MIPPKRGLPPSGMWCFTLCFLLAGAFNAGFQVQADEQEYRLIRYLMSNYDPAVRPSINASLPLRVVFDLSLHQIHEVDEQNQILTTNCWLTQKWNDVHLKWNASDFGGISAVRIPAGLVWKPDVVLFNNADSQSLTSMVNANVILQSSGDMVWLSSGVFKSTCDIDIEFFPFDVQTCQMKFASWTYNMFQVELTMEKDSKGVASYQPNGQFELNSFSAELRLERSLCCNELYHSLVYTVSLRRHPIFFILNLILPCFVINLVSVFSFYIPCNSGEKVTLGIGSLLSVTVLLAFVRESLPIAQKTPLISIYYGITLILVACATVFSILMLNVHHRGARGAHVPQCVKRLVLGCLAKLVFVSFSPQHKEEKSRKLSSFDGARDSKAAELEQPLEHYTVSPRLRHRSGDLGRSAGEEFERRFLHILDEVHAAMGRNEQRVANQERREALGHEWALVALVCDRLLLALFLTAALASALALLLFFLSPPT